MNSRICIYFLFATNMFFLSIHFLLAGCSAPNINPINPPAKIDKEQLRSEVVAALESQPDYLYKILKDSEVNYLNSVLFNDVVSSNHASDLEKIYSVEHNLVMRYPNGIGAESGETLVETEKGKLRKLVRRIEDYYVLAGHLPSHPIVSLEFLDHEIEKLIRSR